MVGSIDPRCETLRGTHWPVKVAGVFGTRVAENHLGQRFKATASTGRTYGCKRSDQTLKNSCGTGAVHIWVPAFAGTTILGRLPQRYPGEVRVVLKHHPVDIGCEISEFLGPLPQLRGEERGEDSGQGTECGGVGTAGGVTHQIRLVPELHRQRKQRAGGQVDVLVRSVAAETAQQVVLGDAELRVLAKFFAPMLGRAIEEMRRPFGKVF